MMDLISFCGKYRTGFAAGAALGLALLAQAAPLAAAPSGPNTRVSSDELAPLSIDDKTGGAEKRPTFYTDGNTSLEIDNDGNPNLNRRF